MTVDLSTSIRSGVIMICDSAEEGLIVRAVPGYVYESNLDGLTPMVEFAVDGERVTGETGETGIVGDNLAMSQVTLKGATAAQFIEAFGQARKQIAIRDGISDRPHLLTARGSTKAGAALSACMALQKP